MHGPGGSWEGGGKCTQPYLPNDWNYSNVTCLTSRELQDSELDVI